MSNLSNNAYNLQPWTKMLKQFEPSCPYQKNPFLDCDSPSTPKKNNVKTRLVYLRFSLPEQVCWVGRGMGVLMVFFSSHIPRVRKRDRLNFFLCRIVTCFLAHSSNHSPFNFSVREVSSLVSMSPNSKYRPFLEEVSSSLVSTDLTPISVYCIA